MKITKRQLKRIIKEERMKLLRESVADMSSVEGQITQASTGIAEQFMDSMYRLFDEDPGLFTDRSTQTEWENQVDEATHELETSLRDVINKTIGRIEMMLHGGDYHRGNR